MPFSEMEKAGREAGMQRKIKHVKEMYAKNYKMLMKEIEDVILSLPGEKKRNFKVNS